MSLEINSLQSESVDITAYSFVGCLGDTLQLIWKVFCDCINCLFCCVFSKMEAQREIGQGFFANENHASLALSFCDVETLSVLNLTCKMMRTLTPQVLKKQLAVMERIKISDLEKYRAFLGLPG